MCLALAAVSSGGKCDLSGGNALALPGLEPAPVNSACRTYLSASCVNCGVDEVCAPTFEASLEGHGVCKHAADISAVDYVKIGQAIQLYRSGDFDSHVIDGCDLNMLETACRYEIDSFDGLCSTLCASWTAEFLQRCEFSTAQSLVLEAIQAQMKGCLA